MNILGISDSQDSGAALVRDGVIVSAVNEERINRKKQSWGLPEGSIKESLAGGKISMADVDAVAVASKMSPVFIFRLFRRAHQSIKRNSSQFSYLLNLYYIYQTVCKELVFPQAIESWGASFIFKSFLRKRGKGAKIVLVDHHFCHAAGAFLTSGADTKRLVVTIDGLGDGLTLTVNIGYPEGRIQRIYSQNCFSSVNTYYSRITEYLGFKPLEHEGKVMGLAAYGEAGLLLEEARKLLHFSRGGFNATNYLLKQDNNGGVYRRLAGFKREDIAAAFQKNFETEVSKFVSFWVGRTGIRNVVLSGGMFANVLLNQRICELEGVDSVYVFPHMGDGGIAAGAALFLSGRRPYRLNNVYLGQEYGDEEIRTALRGCGLRYSRQDGIEEKVAALLADGKIVARFNGRMEFGPRALGNRSILSRATESGIKEELNRKLRRTEFMPFAPATIAEEADKCYLRMEKACHSARFMNVSFYCTEWMKKTFPAAVHIDGTARPQLSHSEDNPSFYRVLKRYREITGLPCLINTSFNIHEEPIVCSPEDALRAFKAARLDYLAIGDYLVKGE